MDSNFKERTTKEEVLIPGASSKEDTVAVEVTTTGASFALLWWK